MQTANRSPTVSQPVQEVVFEGVKAAPPVAVTGALLFGMTPSDWITALTLFYLVLQIGLMVPKYRDQFRAWRAERKAQKQGQACRPVEPE